MNAPRMMTSQKRGRGNKVVNKYKEVHSLVILYPLLWDGIPPPKNKRAKG